jgi:hypothetical protein
VEEGILFVESPAGDVVGNDVKVDLGVGQVRRGREDYSSTVIDLRGELDALIEEDAPET